MISRVTDKHLHADVGTFGVRRVGKIVVIEFGTPQGEFSFHVRERSFVKHARGRADDHGNPFRTLEQIDDEQHRLAQDAAATLGKAAPTEAHPPAQPVAPAIQPAALIAAAPQIPAPNNGVAVRDNRRLSPETRARYIAAYVALHTTPNAKRRDIAKLHDLPITAWIQWTYVHREECNEAVRLARLPVLKPSGALL